MDVRSQIASVFVLDHCTGCQACSTSCKGLWTQRPGADHMAWNVVETRPGGGYPEGWEQQERFRGGWSLSNAKLRLGTGGRVRSLLNRFHDPYLPVLSDYSTPWSVDRTALRDQREGPLPPRARTVSGVDGEPADAGPGRSSDDDWADSERALSADPNLRHLVPDGWDGGFFHLPRICNHCVNPSCVAACPSGACHKQGEDGIVLIDQDHCRDWKSCIPACPYQAVFSNWAEGKSEKCHLCYPLLENGAGPACFDDCPAGLRYPGVLLYDAELVQSTASLPLPQLLDGMRGMILDPNSRETARAALRNGITESALEAARRSPVYRFFVEWRLALPIHPEWRTLPMVFYVPPLSGFSAAGEGTDLGRAKASSIRYLASLFSAGEEAPVRSALEKLAAVRDFRQATGPEGSKGQAEAALLRLESCGASAEEAEAILELLSRHGGSCGSLMPHRGRPVELETGKRRPTRSNRHQGGSAR